MLKKIWNSVTGKDKNDGSKNVHNYSNPTSQASFEKDMKKRLTTINNEFSHTFKFLEEHSHSVTFFGSARFDENHPCYVQARNLAKKIVTETKYKVITGGGHGIMEGANRGAYEAGGESIGMNIILPFEQKKNEYLTSSVLYYYFFIRKFALSFAAEAYIFFPGGFGTMDEFFEIITLVQTHKIPKLPIICIGRDFWQNIVDLSEKMRDEFGTISPGDEKLFHIVDSDEEVIEIIKNAPLKKS